jgi:hypothetical protein
MKRLLALLTFVLLVPAAGAAGDLGLTREQFKMYRYYLNAIEHPEVQKMKPEKRVPAIAKDGRFKVKELEGAIEAGEAAGDLKAKCEGGIRTALTQGALAGRLGKVEVDVSDPHAVIYVQWLNEDQSQLEEEASVAAAGAAQACPIASTIQVWAQDKSNPKARVFQAVIAGDRAARFKVEDVADFADTRYMRAFEQVKNAAHGDDLSSETADPKVTKPKE